MKVYKIKVNGKAYRVELESIDNVASASAPAETKKAEPVPASATPVKAASSASVEGGKDVVSPIQGTVVKVLVNKGDRVKANQVLVVVEAMKLENDVVSPYDGEVAEVLVTKGQNVSAKERIVVIR